MSEKHGGHDPRLHPGYLLQIAGDRPFSVKFLNSSPTNMDNAHRLGRQLAANALGFADR